MNKGRFPQILSFFIFLSLVTIFLPQFNAPSWGAEEVRIGLLVPLTGRAATIGQQIRDVTTLAVDDINKAGGIRSLGGAKLKLFVKNDEGKPEVGMSETERLIQTDKIHGIIGAYSSDVSFAATQVAEKYKMPFLVSISVADKISERGFKYTYKLSFKASWNAEDNLKFAKWMGEKTGQKAKSAALLYEDSLWGQTTAKSWKDKGNQYGLTVAGDFPYPTNSVDVTGTILKIKAIHPDILFQIGLTSDSILITRTMRDLDVYPKMGRIASGGGHSDPKYAEAVGQLSNYEFLNLMWSPLLKHPRIKDVNERHKKQFGYDMLDFSGYAYTACWVLSHAIDKAGSLDPEKIREALSKINLSVKDPGVLLFFPVKFDEFGQAPAEGCFGQRLKGIQEIVYPAEGATATPVWPAPKPW
jgi:branched-chain amino acid transport system substrate-binding protein